MSAANVHHDVRMMQLLADRATEGLGQSESKTLNQWLAARPDFDSDALDRTAAAITLNGLQDNDNHLPASLRERLLLEAGTFASRHLSR